MKEALLYVKLDNGQVRCALCAHRCLIKPGQRGICAVRENQKGVLYSLNYRKLIAAHIDPIEKKPFFHYYPGSKAFSIAAPGCNFRCLNCQNYDISQMPREAKKIVGEEVAPEEIVRQAKNAGCRSISYTYSEPTVYFEYAYEIAQLAKSAGLENNFVTNGYLTKEALEMISPYLNAANVDLKSSSDDFYKKICGARLEPVLATLRLMKKLGIWIEVTTLVIPDLNDTAEEFKKIAQFIKTELGADTPWHLSAFYPTYKLTDKSRTPPATLKKARQIGLAEGLHHVYTGNLPGDDGEHTYCHNCGQLLIQRLGFTVLKNDLKDLRCPKCGTKIAFRS